MEIVDRNILGICKDHLNYITMADCKHFRGDAIDLETFSGNIISGIVFTKRRKLLIFKFTECEKTEETLMTSWYPAVTAVFNDKTITKVWSFFIRSILGSDKFLTFGRIYRNFLSQPDIFNAVFSLNWNRDDLITPFIDFCFLYISQGVISITFQYLK